MAVVEAPPVEEQLSFEIGHGFRATPEQSTFKISGALTSVRHELMAEEEVTVQVVNAIGEVLVRSKGRVSGIGFKKHTPVNERQWVERIHTVTLGADVITDKGPH